MAQSNLVYRIEDIDEASRAGVNSEFGHKKKSYDLFRWKGGPFCKHAWKMVLYRLEEQTIEIDGEDVGIDYEGYEEVQRIPQSYIPSPWGWKKEAQIAPNKMGEARGRYPGYKKRKDKI